jgi:hypothetical protein
VVARHIESFHPNCPPDLKARLCEAICSRTWIGKVTVGRAFGIVATNPVRHCLTDYEQLMRTHKLTRKVVRLVVADELKGIIEGWAPVKNGETP